jgi:hypothetical protein
MKPPFEWPTRRTRRASTEKRAHTSRMTAVSQATSSVARPKAQQALEVFGKPEAEGTQQYRRQRLAGLLVDEREGEAQREERGDHRRRNASATTSVPPAPGHVRRRTSRSSAPSGSRSKLCVPSANVWSGARGRPSAASIASCSTAALAQAGPGLRARAQERVVCRLRHRSRAGARYLQPAGYGETQRTGPRGGSARRARAHRRAPDPPRRRTAALEPTGPRTRPPTRRVNRRSRQGGLGRTVTPQLAFRAILLLSRSNWLKDADPRRQLRT